jgi:hypothetical protein
MKLKMRPLRRRTRFERVVKAAGDAAPDIHASRGVKSGVTAVVAATAASAAISALRRRAEGAGSHQ